MASLRILSPGFLTTIQDEGRWGHQASGVPVAGAMDPWSHRLANALVGNDRSAATLETTLLGPELELDEERRVAVCGAEFDVELDGQKLPQGAAVIARAGSSLRFGPRRRGARAYIAVEGGIEVPLVLGSRSTHLLTAMGGIRGRAVAAGDVLPIGPRGARLSPSQGTAAFPIASGSTTLRVLPGPNHECFTAEALAGLESGSYVVDPVSDRMGFRLVGPPLAHTRGGDIISDATPVGAIQVPASGGLILLMADRQTTGGYPKIATVISADLGLAGQLAPGDRVRFAVCSRQDAMTALIAQERAILVAQGGGVP